MDFNFTKFTETGKRFEDTITVTRNRAIGFPTQFCKNNNIKTFKYGILFYDNSNNAIGIKFSNDDNEQGKISINQSKDYGAHLNASGFFKAHRINTKRYSGRYAYQKKDLHTVGLDEAGDLFIIKLKDNTKSVDGGGDDV